MSPALKEEERVEALLTSGFLEVDNQKELDNICSIAAQITSSPVAAVTLITKDTTICKAKYGDFPAFLHKYDSFCLFTLEKNDFIEFENVQDSTIDVVMNVAAKHPDLHYYAAVPLRLSSGEVIGTLCVLDTKQKKTDETVVSILKTLAENCVLAFINSVNLQKQQTNLTTLKHEIATRMRMVDELCLVSETDLRGNITYVNDKHCEVSQYSKEELIGANQNIIRHPDMDASVFKDMWSSISKGELFRASIKNKAKDGTPYYVDATIAPVMNESGKPERYIGIRYDRTAVEKELQHYKAFQNSLNTSHVTCEVSMDGKIVATNNFFNEKYGCKEGELVGKDFMQILRREDGDVLELWKGKVLNGERLNSHYHFVNLQGEKFIFQGVFSPIKNEVNEVFGVLFIGQDITEQTFALNQYIEENEALIYRLEQGQQLSKSGSWEVDLETMFSVWSKQHYVIFEMDEETPSNVLYKAYRKLIVAEDLIMLDELVNDVVQHKKTDPVAYEFRIVVNNQLKFLSGIAQLVLDLNKKPKFLRGVVHDITRFKTELLENAKKSEQLSFIQDLANMGVWVWTIASNEFYFSPNVLKLFNIQDGESTRNTLLQIRKLMGGSASVWEKNNNEIIEINTYGIHFKTQINRINKYFYLSGKLKYDEKGNPEAIIGSFQDITSQKELEYKIVQNNKWIKSLINSMDDLVFVLDEKMVFLDYFQNPNKQKDLLVSPDFFIGKTVDEVGFPNDALTLIRACVLNAITTNSTSSCEYMLELPSGEKWFELKASISQKNFVNKDVICVVRDITESIHAKLEILSSNEELSKISSHLELLLNNSPITIYECLLNENWTMRFMSEHIEELTGYSNSDFIEDNILAFVDVIHPEDRDRVSEVVLNAVAKDLMYDVEYRIIHKDASIKWIWERGRKSSNNQTDPLLVGVLMDVTEKKEFENQLKSVSEELLVQKEAAEKANKAKSYFLSNMSHEIRTPLNGVIGFTNLLQRTSLDANQKNYVKTLKQSSNLLMGIVNDILDFSKIEADKLELDYTSVYLIDVIHAAVEVVGYAARKKQLEFILNIAPELYQVRISTDQTRLRQVLVNLLSNAIKFTYEGKIELGVKEVLRTNEDICCTFFVRDTGKGIAPDKIENIFNAFDQEDISTTRKFGGTGLGLPISNKLIVLMGGKELRVTSEVDKGTEFTFELTFSASFEEKMLLPIVNNEKAYVLDHSEVAAEVLTQELAFLGMTVTPLNTLELIIEKIHLNQEQTHWVFIDEFSVNEDAITSYLAFLKSSNLSVITILMLYSFEKHTYMNQLQDLDNVHTFHKPITPVKLFSGISSILNMDNGLDEDLFTDIQVLASTVKVLVVDDNRINLFLAKKIIGELMPNVELFEAKDGQEAVDQFKAIAPDIIFMDIQMPVKDGHEATREIRHLPGGDNVNIIALTANNTLQERNLCLQNSMNAYLSKPIVIEDLKEVVINLLNEDGRK
jgi:PAS domain S-box-containing protein